MEKKLTVEEGNKLIMFFDGAENVEIDLMGKPARAIKYKDGYYPEWNLPKFNEDWNLLMPVVEKIETLFKESIQFYIKDKRAYLEMDTQASMAYGDEFPDVPECYSGFCDTKIEAVYDTVVQFIQWLNKKQAQTMETKKNK